MTRICFTLLFVAFVLSGELVGAQEPPPAAATPETASTFLGDWTLDANGQYGPATFALTLKTAEGKVVGEISSQTSPKQAIADVTKAGTSLVLRYVLDYQGMPVNVIIRLTPAEGKITADFDFADGAAQMAGTATKKV
jgi:hypothetical protein